MRTFENRCSIPREAVTACGVRLLTMWRVQAGANYQRMADRSRHDSHVKIHQAGRNMVAVRTDGGQGEVTAGGRRYQLGRGSLLLFDFPSLEEYHTCGDTWSFWWVELSTSEALHLPLHQVLQVAVGRREAARCEEVFDKLQAERIDQRCLAAARWQGLFHEWWAGAGIVAKTPSREEVAVQVVLDAVKRRPELPWVLDEMAAACGMSVSSLRCAFQQVLGKSPAQIRIQLKLSYAHEFLRRGDRNVAEVAAALGFCDPYHFSKAFKRQFGFSPSGIHAPPAVVSPV